MSERMLDKLSKNFTRREFACCAGKCPHCGGAAPMDSKLIALLQEIRDALDKPLYCINRGKSASAGSGFRCPKHNAETAGAVQGSFHTTGQAADIWSDVVSAAEIYLVAKAVIKKLGYGYALLYKDKNFVHVDVGVR